MKKTETLRQLAASSNEQRMADLGMQIEALRRAKIESADHLASILEPIAQAMAALTDETRRTMIQMAQRSEEQAARFERQVAASEQSIKQTSMMASQSAERLDWAGQALELRHYVLAVAIGLVTAALVSAFWLWLAPPIVVNQMDATRVAEQLRPAIEALKPSKHK